MFPTTQASAYGSLFTELPEPGRLLVRRYIVLRNVQHFDDIHLYSDVAALM